MIIDKYQKKGGVTVYAVSADIRETGANRPHTIAEFDDFETAVLVMKFVRGDRMTEEDQRYAKEAIRRV